MASPNRPIICVIHGAWHQPLHYAGLINPLRQDGYTVLAPVLASTGADLNKIAGKTVHDDAAVILEAVEAYMKDGYNVVLVCHSYGGLVATEAAVGQSPQERAARGLTGGLSGIVYMSPILFPNVGMSSWDLLFGAGANVPPWITLHDTYTEVNASIIFYSDVDEPLADICSFALVKQSLASVKCGVEHVASEVKTRKIFVACKKAQNNPLDAQIAMAKAAEAEVVLQDSGHSHFLVETQISELVRVIQEI